MNDKPTTLSTVDVDPLVIRHSETKCSYKCRYYQDGAVLSYCNKYHKPLKYERRQGKSVTNGTIPPLLLDECRL